MGQLTGARMAAGPAELSEKFDWVILDTSPVVLLPDANLLAGMVDGAVIVIRAGHTSYDLVDRAIQTLGRKRILGLILNQVDDKVSHTRVGLYRSSSVQVSPLIPRRVRLQAGLWQVTALNS